MEIVVADPSKQSDSFGSYIRFNLISFLNSILSNDGFANRYKVTAKSDKLGFDGGESIVLRRYNDFGWLGNELGKIFPGAIVPPLPEKQTVGNFDPEFVESRRRALEKFLRRIAENEELGNCEIFFAFLQADEVRWKQTKEGKGAEGSKRKGSISKWFQGTVNSISGPTVRVIYIILFLCLSP